MAFLNKFLDIKVEKLIEGEKKGGIKVDKG
jgi:hypothetical protein